MIDELEALVGHIFIVGGRAVSATPPGALVELPPKKPQRGREQDTFFTLVTSSGPNQGQAAFYEQLAKLAADYYFRSSGSVTSGLREAINAVNGHLIDHNQITKPIYEANVACLVLRGHEVYMGRTGASLCLLRQGATLITYPEELADALNGDPSARIPLGRGPVLDIKLSRFDVAPGHVLALADPGFAKADRDKLAVALGGGSIQAVVELLKPLGGTQAQAMIIEFASINAPDPAMLTPLPGTKITRSSTVNGLKAVSKPVSKPISTAVPRSQPMISKPVPLQPSSPKPEDPPIEPSTVNTASLNVTASAAAVTPPVTPTIPTVPRPNPLLTVVALVGTATTTFIGGLVGMLLRIINGFLNRILPEPLEGGPRIPSMLAAGLAVLVPVVVVFVIVALRLSQADLTQFEQMVNEVQKVAGQAETIPTTDSKNSLKAWEGVIQRIDQVETMTGRTNDPTLEHIRNQAQGILDAYSLVTRRKVTPLRSFNANAKLLGPVIRAGTDMYTLDATTSSIYRDTLGADGNNVVRTDSSAVVTQGQAVSSYTVRQLISMVWIAEGGTQNQNVIAGLDAQGILVTYSPTFAPAIAQRLAGSDLWVKPSVVKTWQDKLYILDPGANQIWRYSSQLNTYPDPPTPYFDGNNRPDLTDAVDFAIDPNGNVFVLFSNGTLDKFNAGSPAPFSFTGLPAGGFKSASMMYMDSDSLLQVIYIVDPVDQAILEFTFAGKFQYRFKASDPLAFQHLTGVFADHNNVYAASGSTIYYFSTADLPHATTPGS